MLADMLVAKLLRPGTKRPEQKDLRVLLIIASYSTSARNSLWVMGNENVGKLFLTGNSHFFPSS